MRRLDQPTLGYLVLLQVLVLLSDRLRGFNQYGRFGPIVVLLCILPGCDDVIVLDGVERFLQALAL
jgi:hypothetical protein